MAHADTQSYLINEKNASNLDEYEKSIQQQLTDANKEIEDLKLQLAWLERPYE